MSLKQKKPLAVTKRYEYEHAWKLERVRLAALESALDPGTRAHLNRVGVGPGTRRLEVGAGGGSVAFWLAERVSPGGVVVATDLETEFLEATARGYARLNIFGHDIAAEELPTGFDLVHERWLVEWLPDKRLALGRMVSALRPGGTLLIEEPDFVTIYGSGDSIAVRHVPAGRGPARTATTSSARSPTPRRSARRCWSCTARTIRTCRSARPYISTAPCPTSGRSPVGSQLGPRNRSSRFLLATTMNGLSRKA